MNNYSFIEEKPKIKKLGRYEILEEIGKGQEAIVYKVKYQKNLYALKASNMMHKFNVELLNRVKTNENLCRFIECFEDNRIKCEVYEYCNDGNLTKRLNEQTFDQNSILNFLRQICNGYQELFKNNIIHRDLKPDNIVYHNGIAKIADYGFARFVENPNVQGHFTQKCTPLFASPQIFQALFSSKCDVWSVGLIVYKMIYKVYPHEGVDSIQQLQSFYTRAEENKIDYPKCEMPHIVELVKYMLKYSEKDRISWPQLFVHPLLQQTCDVIYLPYLQNLEEKEIYGYFCTKARQFKFFIDLHQNLLNDLEDQFMMLNIWFSHTLFILGYLNGQSIPITIKNENFRSFQKSDMATELSSILTIQKTAIDTQISFLKVVRRSQSFKTFNNLKQQGQQGQKFENLDIKQQIQTLEINSILKQQLQGFFQPI